MTPSEINVGGTLIGGGRPFVLIAGPCVIESADSAMAVAAALRAICAAAGVPLIFKASFDKANRSSIDGFRGPGLPGLAALGAIKERFRVPITTDVHLPSQAPMVAQVADLLQVPAFLCRQTDLLAACAASGKPVNVKKGQFMAPWDMRGVLGKLAEAPGVLLTERGSCFGYNNLVADLRSLPAMRSLGVPVCFDATHSVQLPGAAGGSSGGNRELAPVLARAAVAVGIDALFLEVHPSPDQALSDGASMIPLAELPALLATLIEIDRAVK